jgi:hypothetical protein
VGKSRRFCFVHPTDCATGQPKVERLRACQIAGAEAKVSSLELAATMQLYLMHGTHLLIEIVPSLLDDDIAEGVRHAGLKADLYLHGNLLVFCPGIYDQDGQRQESFFHAPERPLVISTDPTIVKHDIYLNSRYENRKYLEGLDYLPLLIDSLAALTTMAQTKNEKLWPFLSSLQTVLAIGRLLGNFPSGPHAGTYQELFQQLYSERYANTRLNYSQLESDDLMVVRSLPTYSHYTDLIKQGAMPPRSS